MILDTSILIATEKAAFDLKRFLAAQEGTGAIAAISASELLHGCHRAVEGRGKLQRSRFVSWVLSEFAVLPFTINEARIHARLWAGLTQIGQPIGSHDLLIAATALSCQHSIATINVRDFIRVPGLTLISEEELSAFKLV